MTAKMTPPTIPMPPRTPRVIHSAVRSLDCPSLPLWKKTPCGAVTGLFMMGLGTTPGLTPMLGGTPTLGAPTFGMPALGTLGMFGTPTFGAPRSGSRTPGLGITGGLKPGLAAGGLKPGLGPKFGGGICGGICGKPELPTPGRGSSVGRPKASTLEKRALQNGQLVEEALTRLLQPVQ